MGVMEFGENGVWTTLNADGTTSQRKAQKCDECYKWRPEDELITIFLNGSDDWILICKDCRK